MGALLGAFSQCQGQGPGFIPSEARDHPLVAAAGNDDGSAGNGGSGGDSARLTNDAAAAFATGAWLIQKLGITPFAAAASVDL